jgi:hypothetical protein
MQKCTKGIRRGKTKGGKRKGKLKGCLVRTKYMLKASHLNNQLPVIGQPW